MLFFSSSGTLSDARLCVCGNGNEDEWDWRFGVGALASFLGKTGGTCQFYISLANRAVGPTYVWRRKLMHQARSPELWLRSKGNCKDTKRNMLIWETTDPSPWRLVPHGLDLAYHQPCHHCRSVCSWDQATHTGILLLSGCVSRE